MIRFPLIALCFLAGASLGQAQVSAADPYSGREFQALVRKADPLPVEESLKAFDVPDGFGMELVAVSPDIGQPRTLAFDERGRLWVSSTLSIRTPHRLANPAATRSRFSRTPPAMAGTTKSPPSPTG